MTEHRTWDLPPEPGPEVTAVKDRDQDTWFRVEGGWVDHHAVVAAQSQAGRRSTTKWEEGPALYLPLIDVTPAGNGEAPDPREQLDALTDRLRAAIMDVVHESGMQSPQHLRLLYVLTGQGESPLSPRSVQLARESQFTGGQV